MREQVANGSKKMKIKNNCLPAGRERAARAGARRPAPPSFRLVQAKPWGEVFDKNNIGKPANFAEVRLGRFYGERHSRLPQGRGREAGRPPWRKGGPLRLVGGQAAAS